MKLKQYVWLIYKTGTLMTLPVKGDIIYNAKRNRVVYECLGEL